MGGTLHANGFLNLSSAKLWGRNGGFRYDRVANDLLQRRCHGGGYPGTRSAGIYQQAYRPLLETTGSITVAAGLPEVPRAGGRGNTPQTPQFNSFYRVSTTRLGRRPTCTSST